MTATGASGWSLPRASSPTSQSKIAGEDADIVAVIPAGADAHSFSATTTDIRNISAADIVIVNGYNLEEGALGTIFEHLPGDATLVVAAEGVDPLEGGHHEEEEEEDEEVEGGGIAAAEGVDPHMWLSVPNAMVYVRNIANGLVAADPDNASAYREREEAYLAELQALDEEVRATIAGIPRERRVLIVYHDAFQYFAAEYGLDLAAAVLPASPSQQASAAAVAEIIEIVAGRQCGRRVSRAAVRRRRARGDRRGGGRARADALQRRLHG